MGCEDEASFGLLPNVTRGWARKGSRPTAPVNFQRKYTNVFATRTKRALVYTFFKKKRQKQFVEHCKQVVRRFNKVALFVDSGPCHKGKQVREFLRKHRKTFRLIRFLKYAPELNPAEPCWKPARKDLANRALRTVAGVKYRLRKIYDNPKNMPKMYEYLSN